jgi:ribonuclease HI
MPTNDVVELFTDGACSGNPGPGGWGVILRWNGHEKELSGGVADTTNNRMELQAVIEGLKSLKRKPTTVIITTDSKYVMDGAEQWLEGWKAKGWRRKGGEIKNIDLWQELDALLATQNIRWEWIKGHAGHPENERADALAVAAAKAYA